MSMMFCQRQHKCKVLCEILIKITFHSLARVSGPRYCYRKSVRLCVRPSVRHTGDPHLNCSYIEIFVHHPTEPCFVFDAKSHGTQFTQNGSFENRLRQIYWSYRPILSATKLLSMESSFGNKWFMGITRAISVVAGLLSPLCKCRDISYDSCRLVLTLSPPILLRLYTLPYWSNPPFIIFDIRALWRSGLSARAPECQKL